MVKFRSYWDKDKEELWLNEMSQMGWAMTGFFLGFYTFEPCEPGEYIYQIDLFTENKRHMSYSEYLSLIRESGAEYICRWGWWRFFRRRAELGDFQLYTDVESRIEQLQRIFRFFRIMLILEIIIFTYDLVINVTFYMDREHVTASMSGTMLACLMIMTVLVVGIGNLCYRIRKKIDRLKGQLI